MQCFAWLGLFASSAARAHGSVSFLSSWFGDMAIPSCWITDSFGVLNGTLCNDFVNWGWHNKIFLASMDLATDSSLG
jgi:hypothetical protein